MTNVYSDIEKKHSKKWKTNKIFKKSIENRNEKEFIFYDGPPFANGLPHYGHLLTGFVKDAFARYRTILEEKTERRFGWDCHGLPAEMEIEKTLHIQGKKAIEEYGIENFNNECKTSVMKYSTEWQNYIDKQGRWVDFEDDYRTMDIDYMESTIWAFKELYNKSLIYEDFRVVPYSWKCQSIVSNFETKMDNAYREKTSKSVFIKFKLKKIPIFLSNNFQNINNIYLIAWTTTPWTLPANLALAVNQNLEYVAIEQGTNLYICAKDLKDKIKSIL